MCGGIERGFWGSGADRGDGARVRENPGDGLPELNGVEWFAYDAIDRVVGPGRAIEGCQHKDWLSRGHAPDLDRQLVAFNKWHFEIGEHQVKFCAQKECKCLRPVRGFDDEVGIFPQQVAQDFAQRTLILNK